MWTILYLGQNINSSVIEIFKGWKERMQRRREINKVNCEEGTTGIEKGHKGH